MAVIFAVYRPALNFDFVWDDNLYVVRNEAVHDWSRAAEAFTSPRTTWSSNPDYNISEWRPLRNISYLVDYSLFGLNPIGWHLHNILLHCTAAVLLFFLIRRLTRLFAPSTVKSDTQLPPAAEWICVIAAAWWALHPVHTEVVAWVKSRDDLLATPLFLGALLLTLPRQRDAAGPAPLAFCTALVLYAAALLSKENTVVVAAIYPLIALTLLLVRKTQRSITGWGFTTALTSVSKQPTSSSSENFPLRSAVRWTFWTTFIIGLMSLAFLALRDIMLGRTAQAPHPGSASETALTMLYAFARYIQLILWPWPPTVQSADYDAFPIFHSWLNPGALSGLALLLAMFAIGWAGLRRVPVVSIGIAFFLIAMLPFANLIPMMQIMAERFLYLPMIGVAVIMAGLMAQTQAAAPVRRFTVGAALVIVLALACQTRARLPVWQNEITLFKATRDANPRSWRPADHFAKALLKNGQTTSGLTVASENLARWPYDPDIVRTAALAHLLAGNETAGVNLTARAVALQPDDSRASITLEKWRALQPRNTTSE